MESRIWVSLERFWFVSHPNSYPSLRFSTHQDDHQKKTTLHLQLSSKTRKRDPDQRSRPLHSSLPLSPLNVPSLLLRNGFHHQRGVWITEGEHLTHPMNQKTGPLPLFTLLPLPPIVLLDQMKEETQVVWSTKPSKAPLATRWKVIEEELPHFLLDLLKELQEMNHDGEEMEMLEIVSLEEFLPSMGRRDNATLSETEIEIDHEIEIEAENAREEETTKSHHSPTQNPIHLNLNLNLNEASQHGQNLKSLSGISIPWFLHVLPSPVRFPPNSTSTIPNAFST